VLPEAEKEAKSLNLSCQLGRVVNGLKKRQKLKGFKKIQPKTANTYEARLKRKYRAFMIFEQDTPTIFKVGDHLPY